MGFEFNALRDEIADLRREIAALKRFASSGAMQDISLVVRTSGGANVVFDGPDGGLSAQIQRTYQWAWIGFAGQVVSVTGASGAFTVCPPFSVLGVRADDFTPVGRAEVHDVSAPVGYDCICYTFDTTPQPGFSVWTQPPGQLQAGTASPFTWAIGDYLRGFVGVRVAPGF